MKRKNEICVKVYLNAKNFPVYVKLAEKAGIRRMGLQLFTQKEHGFAGEMLANTDKLAKFFKFTANYYAEHEADRLEKLAELARKERELTEEKKKLGVV